ncbi:hypothetical protein Y032_0745g2015 [Ancylostoma ceylanicum]|uniref:Uncharacterized protein n=1 Tax=Ancylostoma ceylanicum TaxID=53326 RepID=A0A016WEP1_9BILA|nr:hypothetical protein Y032_0745g2015 [Ancylostoma ceylanicum]
MLKSEDGVHAKQHSCGQCQIMGRVCATRPYSLFPETYIAIVAPIEQGGAWMFNRGAELIGCSSNNRSASLAVHYTALLRD